jgi:hypothetical protein
VFPVLLHKKKDFKRQIYEIKYKISTDYLPPPLYQISRFFVKASIYFSSECTLYILRSEQWTSYCTLYKVLTLHAKYECILLKLYSVYTVLNVHYSSVNILMYIVHYSSEYTLHNSVECTLRYWMYTMKLSVQ